VGAYRIDKETRKKGLSFSSDPLAKEIAQYNEIDCKVLQEILFYLREYHINPNDPDLEDEIGLGLMSCEEDGSSEGDVQDMVISEEGMYILEDVSDRDVSDVSDVSEISERNIEDVTEGEEDSNGDSDNDNNRQKMDLEDSSYEPSSSDSVDWYEYNSENETDVSDSSEWNSEFFSDSEYEEYEYYENSLE
jgi:hypothetical protein